MSAIINQPSTDIEALQALLAAAQAERDAAIAERDQALSQMDRLRLLLRQLQRAQFGRRSEKLDPEQLQLAFEDIEQAIAGKAAAEDKKDPAGARARADKRRASRGSLPGHLPHIDVTIAPEDTDCPCCGALMHVIGEETSKRLDVVPAQFRVIVTHRPKYACRACTDGVVQAPAPERLIKGGLPTEAMVAQTELGSARNPMVQDDAIGPKSHVEQKQSEIGASRIDGPDRLTYRPRRYRDKDHLRFIAAQPWTVCGRKPCEAHHLRSAQPRALGRRVSDEFTVPAVRIHHRELHDRGDETAWWNKVDIDPMRIALRYW